MICFTAECPKDDRRSSAEAACNLRLPWLVCPRCEDDWRALKKVPPINPSPWIESDVWYPTCRLQESADSAKFTDEHAVTLAEFEELRRQVAGAEGRNLLLPPGSEIVNLDQLIHYQACTTFTINDNRTFDGLLVHGYNTATSTRLVEWAVESEDWWLAV